jgi:tRNA modification GTPase
MPASEDTIAAIATPPGEGGVGIVRLSGPEARPIARRIFRPSGSRSIERSHYMAHGHIYRPDGSALLDEALVCYMAGPRSYTGEDVVELHCHGSPVVLRGVLASCLECGARLADRGEFTLRAYLNGRLDLAQAEAVVNIVRARTATAAQVAAQGVAGALGKRLNPIIHALTGTLAYLEATIDFVEEGLPEQAAPALTLDVAAARSALESLLTRAGHGALLRDGVRVVITGRPNVGKSSLLNALLRRDRAIVTPIAGTTRDTLEEPADIHGIPMFLVDTAGLADSDDIVERFGVERSHGALRSAAIVLFVLDGSMPLSLEDVSAAQALKAVARDTVFLLVINKCDLPDSMADSFQSLFDDAWRPARVVHCTALEERSLAEVEDALADLALQGQRLSAEDTLVENARQSDALREAVSTLRSVEHGLRINRLPELVCVDLRLALDQLGLVTGIDIDETVLSRIFTDFCIGK